MTLSVADRHKADNEAIFRKLNERLKRGVEKANAIAAELDEKSFAIDEKAPLGFFCECADENCQERIQLSLKDYKKIHTNPRRFTIVPGHQVENIEEVTAKEQGYWVVTKYEEPPELSTVLQPTDVQNV